MVEFVVVVIVVAVVVVEVPVFVVAVVVVVDSQGVKEHVLASTLTLVAAVEARYYSYYY